MKLIECEHRDYSGLIQELPFSIKNFKKLKKSENFVYLVDDGEKNEDYFNFNYYHDLDYAYASNTLFYEILYNYQSYTEEEIEYLIKFIDFDDCGTYTYSNVVEEYFDVDEIMENKYLKDKVNQKLILIIGGYYPIDILDYENDDNELDVKKAFKEWKEYIIKYYGLKLSDEDWKECFIHYANKTYGDIDEDELE